jgi:putative transposase
VKYAFIKHYAQEHSVRRLCQVMDVHPSGIYAWQAQSHSARAKDDARLVDLFKQAWLESGGVYGYRKLTLDMRKMGRAAASIA